MKKGYIELGKYTAKFQNITSVYATFDAKVYLTLVKGNRKVLFYLHWCEQKSIETVSESLKQKHKDATHINKYLLTE